MLKNYFKIALRNITQQKGYVLINVLGLSIGIACSILIFLFISYELSYDNYHEKSDRIYRMYIDGKIAGDEIQGSYTAPALAPTIKRTFPEIEDACRLDNWSETVIDYEGEKFIEDYFVLADSSFFNIFSFPLINGDPKKALTQPYTAVVNETTSKKIFGDIDPIGKMIKVSSDTNYYQITGVMKDIPENSHFSCNIVASITSRGKDFETIWLMNNYDTYLLLNEGATKKQVEDKIPALLEKNVGPALEEWTGIPFKEFLEKGNRYAYYLQDLADIHLNTDIIHDLKPNHDKKYIYIFSVVAIMILIIASINYMNLATARSANRSKEVGIRKVSGSSKTMLIKQFLTESILLALISILIALIIVLYTLPSFSNLIQIPLDFSTIHNIYLIPAVLILAVIIGLFSGSYPSFYLSAFKPTEVLYGKLRSGMKNGKIRSILVIIQFAISILLITGTIIMYKQTSYMVNKDLGFNKEQLLVIRGARKIGNQIKSFKAEIKNLPGVVASSHSTMVPGFTNNHNSYNIEGRPKDELYAFNSNWADLDFIKVYGIELVEGKLFDEETNPNSMHCIVNESAIKDFNIKDPFNTNILFEEGKSYKIIGIVEDFHTESLHQKVSPFAFFPQTERSSWGYITVKLSPDNITETIKQIENTWNEFTNNEMMLYFFMDKNFEKMYGQEKTNSKLSVIFAVFAIIIACLGLLGLTSFTTEQRTKEIGIRKAMGSSVSSIFYLITKDILKLILIASAIAIPASIYLFKNWLNNFHYRINLTPTDFIWGVLITTTVAILSISILAIRAANTNPATALRYE